MQILPLTSTELENGDWTMLESVVDKASDVTNLHLMTLLQKKFHVNKHMLAFKQYLLLGQGDFIQYLMDTLGCVNVCSFLVWP